MALKELVKKIKEKKELSSLPDEFVSEITLRHLSGINPEKLSSSDKKLIVKEARAELRRSTGMFQKGFKDREYLLEKEDYSALLNTHSSTAERLEFYPELKKIISELNPKSILDLGCGLNPLAIASKSIIYYAVDIKEDELRLIEKFFRKNSIKGKIFVRDLRKPIDNLPSADLCLIFKLFDILSSDRKQAEYIIKNLKCKFLLVSFSTKTLSGRQMRFFRRLWFERMLSRLSYSFSLFKSSNEIFYLVKKS